MIYVHVRAHRIVPGIEHRKHKIAASDFHVANHLRRRKHARPFDTQESDRDFVSDYDLLFPARTGRNHAFFCPAMTPRI